MGKVYHASYSGYFPFCIQDALSAGISTGDGTARPLGMSLENAMKLYWRIKKIKLETPRSGVVGYAESTKAEEEELVCEPNPISGFAEDSSDNVGGPNTHLRSAAISVNGSGPIYKTDDLYFPEFSIEFIDDAYDSEGNISISGVFSTIDPGTYNSTSIFNFLGLGNVTLYLRDSVGSPQIGNISIEEYWSYGGTYNTTTGLPL